MKMKKMFLFALGFISLILGAVGVGIPVLPTTPFVLLSAVCFSSSSKRLNDWLHRNRLFGPFIENYRTRQGISKRHKIASIAFLWVGLIISMTFVRTTIFILGIVGVGVTVHLFMIKNKK